MKITITILTVFLIYTQNSYSTELIAFRGGFRQPVTKMNKECTCNFNRVEHNFVDNTIEAIAESFKRGATIGHFNIQRTSDNKIISFHDWALECSTNGKGVVHKQSLKYLKSLDLAYNFQLKKNGVITYPLRGKYIGKMPTIEEIMTHFPDKKFVIHPKDKKLLTLDALKSALDRIPPQLHSNIYYMGENLEYVKKYIPSINIVNSAKGIKQCAYWYLFTGWSNYIHPSCKNTIIVLPLSKIKKIQKYHKNLLKNLIKDFHRNNTQVWIYEVNSKEDYEYIKNYNLDAIGTYRMDKLK